MAVDWLQTLEAQGTIAQSLVSKVPVLLAREDLTLDQAALLHRIIQKGAKDVEGIAASMQQEDLDEAFHRATTALQDLYAMLLAATVEKMRAMQDLRIVVEQD